jgi:hypothetical protein
MGRFDAERLCTGYAIRGAKDPTSPGGDHWPCYDDAASNSAARSG